MKQITTVLFDMDGVVIDSEPLWELAQKEIFSKHYNVNIEWLIETFKIKTTGHRIDTVTEQFSRYLPEKNINPNILTNQILDAVTQKIISHEKPMPGLEQAIQLIRSLNLKIGLASSSPMRIINTVLDTLNIRHYFDVIVSAETLNYGKPHPEVYLEAAKQLNTPPMQCITIEDSIAGMIATRAANMHSIVMPAKNERNKPEWSLADYKIDTLSDITADYFK